MSRTVNGFLCNFFFVFFQDILSRLFPTDEAKWWLKSWHAIYITTTVLKRFLKTELKQLYNEALQSLPITSLCKILGEGPRSEEHKCEDELMEEIKKHNVQKTPKSWRNGKRSKWCLSYWEFAKCFILAQGYKKSNKIKDVDLNAIIGILKNCSTIQNNIGPPLTLELLENVSFLFL